ncbi:hypothetical protein FOCC_FOCC007089 [Frankliniella occidentalis]|nr:hypothetical protein FOCC_FOCC007089 [Frankliniella occidentalis]
MKILWLSSPLSPGASQVNVSVDRHILFQLQELLAFRLNSVISESSHHSVTVCSQSQSVSYATKQSNDINQNEIWKMQAFSDHLHANRVKIQASANFIQAVIHLKALAEAQTTIPFDKYNTSVSLLCNRKSQVNFPYNFEESLFAHPLPSDDSGFCTTNDNVYKNTETVKGVASSVILYIVNSCNADELLQKSVESIIVQLRDIALKDDGIHLHDTINQWRGSAYHHAMVAFQSVFSGQQMNMHRTLPDQQLCLSILQEMLEHVSKKKYSSKITSSVWSDEEEASGGKYRRMDEDGLHDKERFARMIII